MIVMFSVARRVYARLAEVLSFQLAKADLCFPSEHRRGFEH